MVLRGAYTSGLSFAGSRETDPLALRSRIALTAAAASPTTSTPPTDPWAVATTAANGEEKREDTAVDLSIWTIVFAVDLAYLLRHMGLEDFTYYTSHIGVNTQYAAKVFYRDSIGADRARVHNLFAEAADAGVRVVPLALPLDEVRRFLLSNQYAVIMLVNLQMLDCAACRARRWRERAGCVGDVGTVCLNAGDLIASGVRVALGSCFCAPCSRPRITGRWESASTDVDGGDIARRVYTQRASSPGPNMTVSVSETTPLLSPAESEKKLSPSSSSTALPDTAISYIVGAWKTLFGATKEEEQPSADDDVKAAMRQHDERMEDTATIVDRPGLQQAGSTRGSNEGLTMTRQFAAASSSPPGVGTRGRVSLSISSSPPGVDAKFTEGAGGTDQPTPTAIDPDASPTSTARRPAEAVHHQLDRERWPGP
ncbi:hypothetical protein HK101_005546 [Irineochytrium annulatum]|nr:hypothetical protein HK101_005546 [Irineochytrium annulatum]